MKALHSFACSKLLFRLRLEIVLVILVLFTYFSYYPGYMSADTVEQAEQISKGLHIYEDHNPPIMAWLWSFFWFSRDPGPQWFFLLQVVLFWWSLGYFILIFSRNRTRYFWPILLVGVFPSVFGLISTIWKDVWMVISLMWATALIISTEFRFSWWKIFFIILLLIFSNAVRYNAVFAVYPYAVGIVSLVILKFWSSSTKVFKITSSFLLGTVCFILICFFSFSINSQLTDKNKKTYPEQMSMLYDIATIALKKNDFSIFPNYLKPVSPTLLEKTYLVCEATSTRSALPWTNKLENIRELQSHWLVAIKNNWKLIVEHRIKRFLYHMGFGSPDFYETYFFGIEVNPLGLKVHQSYLNKAVMKYLKVFQETFWFKGWPWFILSIIFLITCFYFRKNLPIFFHLLPNSAFLYSIAYLPIGPACCFRFFWWTLVSMLLFIGIGLAFRFSR